MNTPHSQRTLPPVVGVRRSCTLTEAQWATLFQRKKNGETSSSLEREYGVSWGKIAARVRNGPLEPWLAARRLLKADALSCSELRGAKLARARLFGTLDTLRRNGLREWHLEGLAQRLVKRARSGQDAIVLNVFNKDDLAAAGMTATSLLVGVGKSFSRTASLEHPASDEGCERYATLIGRTGRLARRTARVLHTRLAIAPNDDELERIGSLIEAGEHTEDDLAVIRALPADYLRSESTGRHYAIFVDYRILDV